MMFLLPVGILLIVVAAVGLTAGRGGQAGRPPARQVLDTRLARGEITREEHQQRSGVLTEDATASAPRAGWWSLGGLGVALLVAIPLTTGVGTGAGWWDGHAMHMAGHMGWHQTGASPSDPPVSGATEIPVEAGDLWFAPDRIEVEAGSTVNLVFDNTGRAFHDLSIPELDLHLDARPGETASTALRAPEAGTYEFTCTVAGHAAAGMRGELVVTAAP